MRRLGTPPLGLSESNQRPPDSEERKYFRFNCCLFQCWPGYCSWYSNSLRPGRSGDRIPVGARFSAPVWTGSGVHPNLYTMNTGSFPGVKLPRAGVYYSPSSSAEVKERVELYLYPLWTFLAPYAVNLNFTSVAG